MNSDLKICNILIKISVYNQLIEEYIYNRFLGFISDQKIIDGQEHLSIEECEREHIDDIVPKNYSRDIDADFQELKLENCKYYFIKKDNIIFYDRSLKRINFCIKEDIEERILYFVAVKLCEIIVSFLIENNIYCIHSSVCTLHSNVNNGIAFLGQSGVGKTSLAYQMYKCGEQLTNDDVAYFRITPSDLITYKNTQRIGFDDYSIKKVFPECESFVSYKDGLTLDKNRVDLSALAPNAYAEKIIVKHILIVSPTRQRTPEIVECSSFVAYKAIVKSLLPFVTIERNTLIDKISKEIINIVPTYILIPGDSITKTVDFLLSEGRFDNGNGRK